MTQSPQHVEPSRLAESPHSAERAVSAVGPENSAAPSALATVADHQPSPLAAAEQPPSEAHPKPANGSKATSRGGAPRGNANALRTGLRSPKVPLAAKGINTAKYHFRRDAVAAWQAQHPGQPMPFPVVCKIDSATRHHKNGLLIEWQIRIATGLTAAELASLLDKASDFTDRRDKALREIGLDTNQATATAADPFRQFDASRQLGSLPDAPQTPPAPEPAP